MNECTLTDKMPYHHCPTCKSDRAIVKATREPVCTGDKDGCVTYEVGPVLVVALACGHRVEVT